MCPIRSYKIRNSKPCWLTSELIEQMKDRDYFYRKAKRTNIEEYWNIAKFHRNEANFNIRKAKAEYIKEQLKNNEGNSAKFWRTIKDVMPNKKGTNKTNSKVSLCDNNDIAIPDTEVAEHMNAFFANIGSVPTDPNDLDNPQTTNSPLNTNLEQSTDNTSSPGDTGSILEEPLIFARTSSWIRFPN